MKTKVKLLTVAATLMSLPLIAHEHKGAGYSAKFSELGKGKETQYVGRNIHHHVRADDLKSEVGLFEEILPARTLGSPPHKHQDEDEIFVVLKGKVNFLNGDDEVVGKAGTVASLPRGHFHGFWNPYDEPAQLLVFVAPGHFDTFFEAVEKALKANPEATPQQIGGIIAEEAGKMNVTVDMSKLPDSAKALLAPPAP